MEGGNQGQAQPLEPQQQQPQPPAPPPAVEALDASVREQLNLDDLKIRAIGLSENISRLIEEIKVYARTKTDPNWQHFLNRYSMVMFEFNNLVKEVEKVSNAFVVHPHNANSENSTILPVMLASRSLPEIEMDDKSKKEELLNESQDLTVAQSIEKLKDRINAISAACDVAERQLSVARGSYGFGNHQDPTTTQTQDQAQAAKIQEQENLLRAAVNHGEGLRASGDQIEITPTLPKHLIDVLNVCDDTQNLDETIDALNVCDDTQNLDETPEMSPTSDPVQFQSNTISGSSMLGQLIQSPGQAQQKFQSFSQPPGSHQQLHGGQVASGVDQSQLGQANPISGAARSAFSSPAQTSRSALRNQLIQLRELERRNFQSFSRPPGSHQQFQRRQVTSGFDQSQLGQRNPISGATHSAFSSSAQTSQSTPRAAGLQLIGLSAATSFGTTKASPQPYANFPCLGTSMNASSSQQQSQQQLRRHPDHQPWLQPQFRQSAIPALGQPPGSHQQFQGRQVPSVIDQRQLGQGNVISCQTIHFSGAAHSAFSSSAQTSQSNPRILNQLVARASQPLWQQTIESAISGSNPLNPRPPERLTGLTLNLLDSGPTGMLPPQQQGESSQVAFGNYIQQPTAQASEALQDNPPPSSSQQSQQNQQQ